MRLTYNSPPNFTVNTTESADPITEGNSVSFTATATDAESNNWYLAVCKTNSITAANPPTCATNETLCVSSSAVGSGTQNSCQWTTSGTGSLTWYSFACDNHSTNPICSVNQNSSSPLTINSPISISITSDGSISYGTLQSGQSISTIDLSDTQTAQNTGSSTIDMNIKTSAPAGWTLGSNSGNDQFVHEFSTNGGSNWTQFTTADNFQTLATGITASSSQNFDLRITAPSPSSSSSQKSITITIQAVSP